MGMIKARERFEEVTVGADVFVKPKSRCFDDHFHATVVHKSAACVTVRWAAKEAGGPNMNVRLVDISKVEQISKEWWDGDGEAYSCTELGVEHARCCPMCRAQLVLEDVNGDSAL